ncbi:MAG: hypothetical protein ACT4O3_03530 [Elusimicrobiota bacterium]
MRPGSKRSPFFIAAGAALLFLSGCVYLRLLEVKKQLRDFDENFQVSGDPEMVLEFKNPVLTAKDARFLIGADPLESSRSDGETTVHYEFERVRPSTSSEAAAAALDNLSLDVRARDGKLTALVVPPSFLELFSRGVLEQTLRQAARADIVQTRKLARAKVELPADVDDELKSLDDTLSLLGPPLSEEEEEGLRVLLYRYRIVRDDKKKVPIVARLGFSPEDGRLRRIFITWDTASIDVRFIRP